MDGYAPAYVAHNIPLLVVSGLGFVPPDESTLSDVGTRVTSEISIVDSADAQVLLRHFRDNDARRLAWNSRENNGRNRCRVKTVGLVNKSDRAVSLSVAEAQIGLCSTSSKCYILSSENPQFARQQLNFTHSRSFVPITSHTRLLSIP